MDCRFVEQEEKNALKAASDVLQPLYRTIFLSEVQVLPSALRVPSSKFTFCRPSEVIEVRYGISSLNPLNTLLESGSAKEVKLVHTL
jgi:hypothetical protein